MLEQLEQEELEQFTVLHLQLQDTPQLLMRAEEAEVAGIVLTLLVEQALELGDHHHQVPEETQLLKVAEVVEAELRVALEEMVHLDL